jgi:RimJ/RimL family protein N-acetyltransferase
VTRAPQALETSRLSLRWFTRKDASLMLAIWNDPDFIRYVGDRGIRSIRDAEAAMDTGIISQYDTMGYGPYRVAIKTHGAPIGICGLFQRDYLPVPDLGFCLLPAFRRQGLTEEASRAVLEMASSDLGLDRVTAIVAEGNHPSLTLIRKLGAVEGHVQGLTPADQGDDALDTLDGDSAPAGLPDSTLLFEIVLRDHR